MNKRISRDTRRLIPLFLALIGLVLVTVSVFEILSLQSVTARTPESLSGLDIFHDSTSNISIFIGITPVFESKDLRVSIAIENWYNITDKPNMIEIHFPGITYDHHYVLELDLPSNPTPEDWAKLANYSAYRRDPGNAMWLERNYFMLEDVMRIQPNLLQNFSGIFEFMWACDFEDRAEKLEICLPLQAAMPPNGTTLSHIDKLRMTIWSPRGYRLISAVPQPSSFQFLGDLTYSSFDLDIHGSDFYAVFENEEITKENDFQRMMFSALLGVGSTLVVSETVHFVKRVKTTNLRSSRRKETDNIGSWCSQEM